MKPMKVGAAIGLLAALVIGCNRADNAPGEPVIRSHAATAVQGINYVHDDKHGVGCWFYVGDATGSISCLADKDYQR